MSLIDLPQTKWGSGTGRQVILKGDFAKIEQAVMEACEFTRGPDLEYLDSATLRVNATADCKARVIMCGFPSPLAQRHWVDGGLSDGRYRENAAPVSLNLATAEHLWGTEKPDQWYAVYALAGVNDAIFALKAMPAIRVASQDSQVITLRNSANGANIGYGFTANELAAAGLLILSGASRGLVRTITANNDDNGTAGTITYGGAGPDPGPRGLGRGPAGHQLSVPGHGFKRCRRQPGALLPGSRPLLVTRAPGSYAPAPLTATP